MPVHSNRYSTEKKPRGPHRSQHRNIGGMESIEKRMPTGFLLPREGKVAEGRKRCRPPVDGCRRFRTGASGQWRSLECGRSSRRRLSLLSRPRYNRNAFGRSTSRKTEFPLETAARNLCRQLMSAAGVIVFESFICGDSPRGANFRAADRAIHVGFSRMMVSMQ